MKKKTKRIILFLCIFFAVIIIIAVLFLWYINRVRYDYYFSEEITVFSDDEEYWEAEKYKAVGYVISTPVFYNKIRNGDFDREIYVVLNAPLDDYAFEIARKYRNYAKLNPVVDIKKNDTITVTFTGVGYTEDGTAEELYKKFVFDIKGASLKNLPKLIEE